MNRVAGWSKRRVQPQVGITVRSKRIGTKHCGKDIKAFSLFENECMTDKIKIVHLEGTKRRINDATEIVRYMKLETLLLLLFERRAFIPSHATFGEFGPLGDGHSL